MAQYRDGTIIVTAGDATVSGFNTAWLANVKAGDMLLVGATGPAAFIASVVSDTELILEQAWPGADAISATYAIHRDFDPTTGAPLLAPGDTAVHLLVNRAIGRLSVQTAAALASAQVLTARDAAQAAAAATGADRTAVASDRTVASDAAQAASTAQVESEAARDQAVAAAGIALGNASDAPVQGKGPQPIALRDRFDEQGLNVLEFHSGSGTDITAALNLAADAARASGILGLFVPAGSWQVTGSVNLSFAADGGRYGGPGRLNLIGAGAQASWIYVRLTEAFPAFDLTGNTQALIRGLTVQHAADCASTRSFLCAKPAGGYFQGSEAQFVDVQVQRQPNEAVSRPCITIANANLPTLTRCQLYGRLGLEIGAVPSGVSSKFQALSANVDFSLATLTDVNISATDATILFYGGPGVVLNVRGGYHAATGANVPAIGPGSAAKALIHVSGDGSQVLVYGLRVENQTNPVVALDGAFAIHGNIGQSVIEMAHCANDPILWIAPTAGISGTTLTAFCSYNAPAVVKSNGGGLRDCRFSTNRATLLEGSLSQNERTSQDGYFWTTPAGNQTMPGLQIGGSAIGMYPTTRVNALPGSSVLGMSLNGYEFNLFQAGTNAVGFGPGAALSPTSNGLLMQIFGGLAGSTSGNGGPLALRASTPTDGNGGFAQVVGSSGVGTDKYGGNANLLAGAATGTASGGAIYLTSGSSPSGPSGPINITAGTANVAGIYAGNITVHAGDSSNGIPGSLYLDTGVGTASPGYAGIFLRNLGAGPIKFQMGASNRWAIEGTGSYAYHFRPEANGAYDIGVVDYRVRDLYLTNSPNVSSDTRLKLDITGIDDAAAATFITALQPRFYRLGNAGLRTVGYEQKAIEVERPDPETGLITTETTTIEVPIEEPKEGVRLHAGLIAQEVRATLSAIWPDKDLALWGLADPADPDSMQHLRYEQIIPLLIGALRHVTARVTALEASHG